MTPFLIVRPHVLAFRNRLFPPARGRRTISIREATALIFSVLFAVSVYGLVFRVLISISGSAELMAIVPVKLIRLSLPVFFSLVLISNFISGLNVFFASLDWPLLLSVPVRRAQLYSGRLITSMLNSSWLFLLVSVPAIFAYRDALHLPWGFVFTALLLLVPFLLIPAALSSIGVTIFVNFFPVHRIRDSLLVIAAITAGSILVFGQQLSDRLISNQAEFRQQLEAIATLEPPKLSWLPSNWVAEILACYLTPNVSPLLPVILLVLTATATTLLGFSTFVRLFDRGWNLTAFTRRQYRISERPTVELPGLFAWLRLNPQIRAICDKEARTFIRDPAQALQLFLLLILSMLYLYNFKALRVAPSFDHEVAAWWEAVLALANISLGGCVISAIGTRFVYSTVSMEGRAYALLRFAPISIHHILRNKFLFWFFPFLIISLVLMVSGAAAVRAAPEALLISGVIATALSIGIVGLGVGIGAVYARFDWESPSEVSASFGSLVYMLLSLALIFMTLIPAGFMFVLACVPNFSLTMSNREYYAVEGFSLLLCFFMNIAAARRALQAGTQALLDLEK